MAGTSDILERIRDISKSGESLRFLNVYRGLPITYDGKVLDVSEHVARFGVSRYQSICIRIENQTFIQSNLLPEVIRGKVVTVDPWAPAVVLTDFEYKGTLIGKRMHVRVEPEHPIRVTLGANQNYYGDLTEISMRGIAAVLYPPFYSAMIWNRGETIPIEFRIPDVAKRHLPRSICPVMSDMRPWIEKKVGTGWVYNFYHVTRIQKRFYLVMWRKDRQTF